MTKGMTFSMALEALKCGSRVHRTNWNGKTQYLELATNVSYKNPDGVIVNQNNEDIGNRAIAFVGTRGIQVGWLASQEDMLAEDWEVSNNG